ncbi:hypothetical protein ACLM5J_15805 [Nocardioides sp. Bht2]|uniref:hypothetical protein n=1 Tax=Nocardioides sp. Bht2 TaxID=3392297 RepID=UPI0039B4E013
MADKDRPDDAPQLELPSLGSMFRRKKKGAPAPASSGTDRPNAPTAEDFERLVQAPKEPVEAPVVEAPAAEAPAAEVAEVAESVPAEAPVEADEQVGEVVVPAEPVNEAEATAVIPVAEPELAPAVEPVVEPVAAAKPAVVEPVVETEPAAEPEVAQAPVVEAPAAEAAPQRGRFGKRKEPVAAAASAAAAAPALSSETSTAVDEEPTAALHADEVDADDESADDGWRFLSLPELSGPIAAAITGAVVGLLGVGLTYFGMAGCEAIKGTSSCGGSGIGVLILILIALVAVGSLLLTAWKITDPTSTSFLAVGLLAVICLLFLIEVLMSPAMIVVVPIITVVTFLASHWVTTNFVEDE